MTVDKKIKKIKQEIQNINNSPSYVKKYLNVLIEKELERLNKELKETLWLDM